MIDGQGWNAFHVAAKAGRADVVELLLRSSLFDDVNSHVEGGVYRGWTALQLAISSGHAAVVQRLLAVPGVLSFELVTKNARNLYHLAANYAPLAVLRLLFAHDASRGALISSADSLGTTPLALAALQAKPEVVQFLLAHDPALPLTLAAQDASGDTALHHAFTVQAQRLTSFREPISPDKFDAAYLLVLAGAPTLVANMDGDVPFDLLPAPTAALFELAAQRRLELAEHGLSTLPALLAAARGQGAPHPGLLRVGGLREAVEAHLQDVRTVVQMLDAQSGCPMFSASNAQPSRRRKPVPETNIFLERLSAEILPLAEQQRAASSQPQAGGGECPLGFKGQSPHGKQEQGGACPFGFTGKNPHQPSASSSSSSASSSITPSLVLSYSAGLAFVTMLGYMIYKEVIKK